MMLKKSTSPNLILKPMDESDLANVMEIEQLSFPCPWSKGMFLSEFHKRPSSRSYVAKEKYNGEIVGYVLFSLVFEELHILNLAVHPESRRKGIGDILIEFVLGVGREGKTEKVLLEVRVSNDSALALYHKYGFREVGIRRNYYFKPTENARLLQFDLEKVPIQHT
jgi:ribosomal-protein-alanine N-acetyltransferase